MQMTTVSAVLANEVPHESDDFLIYLFRDEETVLYVGQSVRVYRRLQEHLGMLGSASGLLGSVVEWNASASSQWQIYLYTLAECETITGKKYDGDVRKLEITAAEDDMIAHFKSCLNAYRDNPALPERYAQKIQIANSGVMLRRKSDE